jgi:hypothetical protein
VTSPSRYTPTPLPSPKIPEPCPPPSFVNIVQNSLSVGKKRKLETIEMEEDVDDDNTRRAFIRDISEIKTILNSLHQKWYAWEASRCSIP